MTPEQKKEFEEAIEQLKIGLPQGETVAPENQTADAEQVDEVTVDIRNLPDLPDTQPSPIADVQEAFQDGAGEVVKQTDGDGWFDKKVRAANEDVQIVHDEVPLRIPEDFRDWRHEQAKQVLPQLEEFMRDAEREGKLDKQGFLNDDNRPVGVGPDDIEEMQQPANDAGQVVMNWIRKQEQWKEQVIRGFQLISQRDEILTAQLRDILDGFEGRHT